MPAIKAPNPKDGMAAKPATSGGMYLKGTSVAWELHAEFTTSNGKPKKSVRLFQKAIYGHKLVWAWLDPANMPLETPDGSHFNLVPGPAVHTQYLSNTCSFPQKKWYIGCGSSPNHMHKSPNLPLSKYAWMSHWNPLCKWILMNIETHYAKPYRVGAPPLRNGDHGQGAKTDPPKSPTARADAIPAVRSSFFSCHDVRQGLRNFTFGDFEHHLLEIQNKDTTHSWVTRHIRLL